MRGKLSITHGAMLIAACIALLTLGAILLEMPPLFDSRPEDSLSDSEIAAYRSIPRVLAFAAMFGGSLIIIVLLCGISVEKPRASTAIPADDAFCAAAWAAMSTRANLRPSAEEPRVLPSSDGPHQVLGVTNEASMAEIKSAYRRLMKIHHPDRGGDHETAKQIIAAYKTLGGTIRRDLGGDRTAGP